MNVEVPGHNLRLFTKSIQTLTKIGANIYFEIFIDRLSIRTLNEPKSCLIRFDFADTFFSCFNSNESRSRNQSRRSAGDKNECFSVSTVPSKSFQSIFNSLNKEVENCRIIFPTSEEDRIVFRFKFCTGVTKTHWIHVFDYDNNSTKLKGMPLN